MFKPTDDEVYFIGIFLEGFFYGLYSGIFAMYLQCHSSKEDTSKTQKTIFYSLCALYVASTAVFACDISAALDLLLQGLSDSVLLRIYFVQNASFACCDFIAQFILVQTMSIIYPIHSKSSNSKIHRCWIVWGRNIRVVIIPSILTFGFLATWIACNDAGHLVSGQIVDPEWATSVTLTSLALSLTVNALMTGLIVFRIFRVFREVKTISDNQILGATGGSKLRRIIFILVESGMALFAIQLARLVLTNVWTEAAYNAFFIIVPIHQTLTGITPTIILVRTSMGLSFHDEKSMEEVAIGSLHFASVPETRSISIVDQDNRDDDIGIQQGNEIDVVER